MLDFRSVLVAATLVATVAPASASVGGLPAATITRLRALGFAVVVPQTAPPGFRYKSAAIDTLAESYRIVYLRPGDNATLTFSGRKLEAPATPPPKRRHGLFNQLAAAIDSIGTKPSEPSNQVAGTGDKHTKSAEEAESDMGSVEAYSSVIGLSHFAADNGCLSGSPDPGQAPIHDAAYHVTGCNLTRPDALTRAYRSLVRIGS